MGEGIGSEAKRKEVGKRKVRVLKITKETTK